MSESLGRGIRLGHAVKLHSLGQKGILRAIPEMVQYNNSMWIKIDIPNQVENDI